MRRRAAGGARSAREAPQRCGRHAHEKRRTFHALRVQRGDAPLALLARHRRRRLSLRHHRLRLHGGGVDGAVLARARARVRLSAAVCYGEVRAPSTLRLARREAVQRVVGGALVARDDNRGEVARAGLPNTPVRPNHVSQVKRALGRREQRHVLHRRAAGPVAHLAGQRRQRRERVVERRLACGCRAQPSCVRKAAKCAFERARAHLSAPWSACVRP